MRGDAASGADLIENAILLVAPIVRNDQSDIGWPMASAAV